MVTSTSKAWGIAILIAILAIMIIYVIVMFECFKNQTFIFTPYVAPTPPANFFYPLGTVTPLTQEEIDQRNAIIRASVKSAP